MRHLLLALTVWVAWIACATARDATRVRVVRAGRRQYEVRRTRDAAADAAAVARLQSLDVFGALVLARAGGLDPRAVRTLAETSADDAVVGATIDKGRRVEVCVRHDGAPVDDDTLRHVYLHELAHVVSRTHGHTPEFYARLRDLHAAARSLGWRPRTSSTRVHCGAVVDVGMDEADVL